MTLETLGFVFGIGFVSGAFMMGLADLAAWWLWRQSRRQWERFVHRHRAPGKPGTDSELLDAVMAKLAASANDQRPS